MAKGAKAKPVSGYDRYINWKLFSIPAGLLILILIIPTPKSMLDVGVEYALGTKYINNFLARELFNKPTEQLDQWQIQTVRMMEASVGQTAFSREVFLKRKASWCKSNDIPTCPAHMELVRKLALSIPVEQFKALLGNAYLLKTEKLTYDSLSRRIRRSPTGPAFTSRRPWPRSSL